MVFDCNCDASKPPSMPLNGHSANYNQKGFNAVYSEDPGFRES